MPLLLVAVPADPVSISFLWVDVLFSPWEKLCSLPKYLARLTPLQNTYILGRGYQKSSVCCKFFYAPLLLLGGGFAHLLSRYISSFCVFVSSYFALKLFSFFTSCQLSGTWDILSGRSDRKIFPCTPAWVERMAGKIPKKGREERVRDRLR